MHTLILVVVWFCALQTLLAEEKVDYTDKEISQIIERLGSESFEERKAEIAAVRKMPVAAYAAYHRLLQRIAKHEDAEIRRTAKDFKLQAGWYLPPSWKQILAAEWKDRLRKKRCRYLAPSDSFLKRSREAGERPYTYYSVTEVNGIPEIFPAVSSHTLAELVWYPTKEKWEGLEVSLAIQQQGAYALKMTLWRTDAAQTQLSPSNRTFTFKGDWTWSKDRIELLGAPVMLGTLKTAVSEFQGMETQRLEVTWNKNFKEFPEVAGKTAELEVTETPFCLPLVDSQELISGTAS